jgi:tetratricopeptide (TPR) repeat protein
MRERDMRFRFIKNVFLLGIFVLAAQSALAATSEEYYNAGMSLYQKAQYSQSIQYYQAAVQLDPSNWRAYQGMGHSYYRSGNIPEAVKAYDASLKLNPGNTELQKFVDNLKASQPAVPAASAGRPQGKAKSNAKVDQPLRFGIKAGVQMCKIKESMGNSGEEASSSKMVLKPAFGGFLQYKISPKFSFCPELLYVGKGGKTSETTTEDAGYSDYPETYTEQDDTKYSLSYIELPILLRFYPTSGHDLNLIFGPSVGFLMSANYKETLEEKYSGSYTEEATVSTSGDVKQYYNSTDFGLVLGAGYEVGSLTFDLRADLGLSNIAKTGSDSSGYTAKNFAMGLFVGYLF